MKKIFNFTSSTFYCLFLFSFVSTSHAQISQPELLRLPYVSVVDNLERDYFLYLPKGYEESNRTWPVMVFLHGDGERGNGKEDLDYVLKSGPVYEAWIQKRDLPFIIISPQNHLFGRDGVDGPAYIRNRTRAEIPVRLTNGIPPHNTDAPARLIVGPMTGAVATELPDVIGLEGTGWEQGDPDVINMLDYVQANYNTDTSRVYLTGLSMGGFGTWHYASQYPDRFAAILSVVGFPTVEQAETVAESGIPTWVFSGGRDTTVQTQYFFEGMNKMDELGANFRFTTEQDMFHDVWNRVYAGEDIYNWLLQYTLE